MDKNTFETSKPATNGSEDFSCYPNCFCRHISPILEVPDVDTVAGVTGGNLADNQRVEKLHWVCDYADDILQNLRQSELRRYVLCFRSEQHLRRPAMHVTLMIASAKHHLCRTTLHLASYLLDCFMDNFIVRRDKLNLTVFTCLMLAAKIEEADVNMPKFAQLNELIGSNYALEDFKKVECRLLTTLNFDLLSPTTATFAEHFAKSCLTLDDYQTYVRNWPDLLSYHQPELTETILPMYSSYKEMMQSFNKLMFSLVDISLSYVRIGNIRPSIVAAACIAAARQLHFIFPIWTPYLENLTKSTHRDMGNMVEVLLALHKLNNGAAKCKEKEAGVANNMRDSPDSGIISSNDKSCQSYAEDGEDTAEGDPSYCLECPLTKKRRML